MDRWITLLVLLPALGAVAVFASPNRASRVLAAGSAGGALGLATFLLLRFSAVLARGGMLEEPPLPWIDVLGARYAVGMDGLGLPLAWLVAAVLLGVAILGYRTHTRLHLGLTLLSGSALMGCFAARDAFLFYLCWEVMLVPMYFVVGMGEGAGRIRAATRFVVFTGTGSLLLLVALATVWHLHATQVEIGRAHV